jgi:hypothetical protein
VAKNAYTFAKRAKELAKKKKKEEKLQRKSQRDEADPSVEGQPVYDEATGEVIMPEPEPATPQE